MERRRSRSSDLSTELRKLQYRAQGLLMSYPLGSRVRILDLRSWTLDLEFMEGRERKGPPYIIREKRG